jgi:hypothetical protein
MFHLASDSGLKCRYLKPMEQNGRRLPPPPPPPRSAAGRATTPPAPGTRAFPPPPPLCRYTAVTPRNFAKRARATQAISIGDLVRSFPSRGNDKAGREATESSIAVADIRQAKQGPWHLVPVVRCPHHHRVLVPRRPGHTRVGADVARQILDSLDSDRYRCGPCARDGSRACVQGVWGAPNDPAALHVRPDQHR